MGLFSNMMDKILGRDDKTEESAQTPAASAEAPAAVEEQGEESVSLDADTVPIVNQAEAGAAAEADPAPAAEPEPEPMAMVDVESKLDALAAAHAEDLDWKKSIVDLCKLVDIDSSYGARKEMALELGYTQEKIDSDGSAEMNMWLHKEVMRKISENGGKIPGHLLD